MVGPKQRRTCAMKMSMMIPVAGLSMLAGGVMGMALSPKKKTKMQKTVSKAAKVAGDAMENLSGALKM